MKETATQVELNSLTNNKSKAMRNKKQGVEIFSAIVSGKDTSKYGKNVDRTMAYIKDLGNKALNGGFAEQINAKAEINAIREIMIDTPLQKRLNIFNLMGTMTQVGLNEEVRYKVYNLDGKKAGEQANSGSFSFATHNYRTEIMKTNTITGGMSIDYREYAAGNVDDLGVLQEQTITDMMNQMYNKLMTSLYNGVKGSTGVKNFSESAGITKSAVDNAIKKARRFNKSLTIMGDYSVISQMNNFTGFKTDTVNNINLFSQAVMEEIRQTGILKMYNGSPVVEIDNTFDVTKLNAAKDFYDTYLPEGLLFALPNGQFSPLQIGIKGGVTSMAATDINLREEVQRFDLEFGNVVVKEYIPFIGVVSDSNYSVNKQ